ncbi:MAG TPA: ROK family protein [Polyangia bacterium]|nr:ROK family protein [Polyangia bacterium]
MRIGVDLGGTKIEAIALDDAGELLLRRRVPTPHDYAATISAIAELVEGFERELGWQDTRVGIGTPGAVSPVTGLMKNCNSVWLNQKPLWRDLGARLGRPLRLANDANCFALSEARDGAAAGARGVFGVIVGTGTGGGVVIDGRIWNGANAIAGEWGHNPLPWPQGSELGGPGCWCGQTGCIELYLSGPGLARDHQAATGDELAPADIAARADQGDPAAEATLRRYEDRMARALATVINLLDPDVIVLGGGLSKMARLYTNVPPLLGRHVFSDQVQTRLLPPRHGDASGVRGAAWLWDSAP